MQSVSAQLTMDTGDCGNSIQDELEHNSPDGRIRRLKRPSTGKHATVTKRIRKTKTAVKLSRRFPSRQLYTARKSMRKGGVREMNHSPMSDLDDDAISSFIERMCVRNLEAAPFFDYFMCFEIYRQCMCPEMNSFFLTGSKAEFYIQPKLNCIDDIDVMTCDNFEAAFFRHDDPSLPWGIRGFTEIIECYKTGLSEFPGYYTLSYLGDLVYEWKSGRYNFSRCRLEPSNHSITRMNDEVLEKIANADENVDTYRGSHTKKLTGPAMQTITTVERDAQLISVKVELVYAVYCPEWPSEAVEWLSRPRKHGWPDNGMIYRIVRNGCHLVRVSHPECGDEERGLQFRLSFSHAEVILLRSWTPVQQAVYHLLRYFAKREFIKKECQKDEEILTGYHLKTIMLYTCESESIQWWHSTPLLRILGEILVKLSNWLQKKSFPNYFIPSVCLLRENLHSENLTLTLEKLDRFSNLLLLTDWFFDNWVEPVRKETFGEESTLFMGREIVSGVTIGLNVVMNFKNLAGQLYFHVVETVKLALGSCRQLRSLGDRETFLHALHNDDSSTFLSFCRTVLILCFDYLRICKETPYDTEFVVDMIRGIPTDRKIMYEKSHNFPNSYRMHFPECCVYLLKAEELMETITAPTNDAEYKLLCEISLKLLRKCIEACHPESWSVCSAAVVYAAALLYGTSYHKEVTELCSLITTDLRPPCQFTHEDSAPLSAFCLLFIDDVARITGFYLLCKKTQNPLLYKTLLLDNLFCFTPCIFVEYLTASSTGRSPMYLNVIWRCNISNLFPLDVSLVLLSKRVFFLDQNGNIAPKWISSRRCVYLRRDLCDSTLPMLRQIITDDVYSTDLLFQWCIDEMNNFAKFLKERYYIPYDTVDCYCISFLFNRGQYTEVTRLCNSILSEPDSRIEYSHYIYCLLMPPFDGFFDKDIQFLLGLQTLCHICRPTVLDVGGNNRMSAEHEDQCSSLSTTFTRNFHKDGVDALKSLYRHCTDYYVRKRFVAQYLLFRTAVALKEPRSKVLEAFRRIKCRLHFERVIHEFLNQRFRFCDCEELPDIQ